MKLVIEPINHRDMPGYFLNTEAQGAAVVEAIGRDRLGLQFDVYHCQTTEGDITKRMEQFMPVIAHMQIADVPARNEPGTGEIGWEFVFRRMDELGYQRLGRLRIPAGGRHRRRAWLAGIGSLDADRLRRRRRRVDAVTGSDGRPGLAVNLQGRHSMKIGFIGLGIMGRPMALNLHDGAAHA